jgi:hypothetical protein
MSLTRSSLAVLNPLLYGSVLVPGIVSGKDLDPWHALLVEDFILLIEKSDGFFGCLVLVDTDLDLL